MSNFVPVKDLVEFEWGSCLGIVTATLDSTEIKLGLTEPIGAKLVLM